MGCWWNLDGTVKPQDGKMDEAAKILSEYDCYFSSGIEEGTFDLSFGDERGYSFTDDLAEELAPLLLDGEIDVHNDDDDTYCRYSFHDGRYTFCAGDKFIYFSGFEDDFAETLPDEVVQAVLRKYAKGKLSVKTPGGVIEANISPDPDYPGIWVQNVSMPGEPGAVMEYGPVDDCETPSMKLRVYKAEDPDGNPDVYRMGKEQLTNTHR